jgi:kinesin family protein 1
MRLHAAPNVNSDLIIVYYSIHNEHCVLKLDGKKVRIKPCEKDCRVLVNGSVITGETDLDHNDRLVFGSTHIWVFGNPHQPDFDKKKYPPITYDYAQEEIAAKAGINMDHAASSDVALLQEDLIDVMPAVEEANSISEELDKKVKFEIILISPQMLGQMQSKVEVNNTHARLSQGRLAPN